MAWFFSWPKFDWKVPARGPEAWITDRIFAIAALARRFELAFTSIAEEGLADLSVIDFELAEWDRAAGQFLVHTVWGEARRIPATDKTLPKRMEKAYEQVLDARAKVLKTFGRDVGSMVADREEQTEVNPDMLRPPPPPPPPKSFTHFTGEFAAMAAVPMRTPVSADEVLKRTAAEQKPLPDSRNLGALLALLPSDWVMAVFEQLNLSIEDEFEMTTGSRSTARRAVIFKAMVKPDFLAKVVDALGKDERGILSMLLENEGLVPYKRVTSIWTLDESDGFYWNARPAAGPLSLLRRKALAFVGTRHGSVMLAAPADLLVALRGLLPPPPTP